MMTASGTFGSGMEYSDFVDLNRLGAVVTKGVANIPWPGNPTPRVAETHGGMLNAIGLQNPGIDVFVERDLPFLSQYDTRVIVNICGKSVEDYLEVVERLSDEPVDLLVIMLGTNDTKERFGSSAACIALGLKRLVAKAIAATDCWAGQKPNILIVTPKTLSEVQDIIDSLRNRQAIIVQFNKINEKYAQRILDFLNGAIYALGGCEQRIGDNMFLFTPGGVSIQGPTSLKDKY